MGELIKRKNGSWSNKEKTKNMRWLKTREINEILVCSKGLEWLLKRKCYQSNVDNFMKANFDVRKDWFNFGIKNIQLWLRRRYSSEPRWCSKRWNRLKNPRGSDFGFNIKVNIVGVRNTGIDLASESSWLRLRLQYQGISLVFEMLEST